MPNQTNLDDQLANNWTSRNFSENGQQTSLELVWKNALEQLESWAEQSDYYDQVLLTAVRKYVERVNLNRESLKTITDQFNKELCEWEGTAREELLMTTTIIKQLFPKKSYHDINRVIDDIQSKTAKILITPINAITSEQSTGKYLHAVESYVALRRQARQQYLENIMQTASVFYGNQKMIVNLFQNQFKSIFFPLQRYMESSANIIKK
ncbi:hypothetical protein HHO41_05165 [Bacillus sp. DNRA2]|uniref:hypothetical protein n=1 Tax=Bacillus sp. DNRA2 TaxID=2723053 RepID=UPI00145C7198|nr:hypothetical protein [Bacillus sp. DNRA2]NMD69669.1 hypothetical protein [Bacillus sp. DNRA2]